MSKAWMPFYGGDFLKKTMHLSGSEIGPYVLLIWHCWEHQGCAPDNDALLARIAKVYPPHWRRVRRLLEPFFDLTVSPGFWIHIRVQEELLKNEELSNKRKGAAEHMLKQKRANAEQLLTPSQSPSQLRKKDRYSLNAVSCETGVKAPRHGARSADGRFVYFKRDTDEFAAYVDDYLQGTGDEPNATADGRWFKVYGEEGQPVAEKRKGNGVSSELEATVKARGWA
jgi:uncharacterized protein YdaU (DUF1376 family)